MWNLKPPIGGISLNLGISLQCGARLPSMPRARACGGLGQTAPPEPSIPISALCFSGCTWSSFYLVFTKALGIRGVGGLLQELLPVSKGRQHRLPGSTDAMHSCRAQIQARLRRAFSVREAAEALPPGLRPFFCAPGDKPCYPLVHDSPVTPIVAVSKGSCFQDHCKSHSPLWMQHLSVSGLLPCRELASQKEIFLDLPSWIHSVYFSANCRDCKPNSILLRLVRRKNLSFLMTVVFPNTADHQFLSMAMLQIKMENKGRKGEDTDVALLPRSTCSSVKDVRQWGGNFHGYKRVPWWAKDFDVQDDRK